MSWNRQSRTAEAQAARSPRQLTDLRVLVSDDSKESVVCSRQIAKVERSVYYFLQLAHPKVFPKFPKQGSNFIFISKSVNPSCVAQRLSIHSRRTACFIPLTPARTNRWTNYWVNINHILRIKIKMNVSLQLPIHLNGRTIPACSIQPLDAKCQWLTPAILNIRET